MSLRPTFDQQLVSYPWYQIRISSIEFRINHLLICQLRPRNPFNHCVPFMLKVSYISYIWTKIRQHMYFPLQCIHDYFYSIYCILYAVLLNSVILQPIASLECTQSKLLYWHLANKNEDTMTYNDDPSFLSGSSPRFVTDTIWSENIKSSTLLFITF